MQLTPPPHDTVTAPRPLDTDIAPADAAEALRVMTDVWKNEEARFSNLNSRGVAVVSAASLVTGILGVFTKNILDSTSSSLNGGPRTAALAGVCLALVLLMLSVAAVVFGVLLPGRRAIFGDNDIVSGTNMTAQHIDVVAFSEYGQTYANLANRSNRKAYWLSLGYCLLFLAVLTSTVATAYLVVKFSVPPPAT